jgi:hypothetical protein
VRPVGANRSLSEFVLLSEVSLLDGQPEAPPGLYHWAAGQIRPVSVLPDAEGGGFVGARWAGSGPGSVRNAISEDGSSVFWSLGDYGIGNALSALYVRDMEQEESTRLDVAPEGVPGPGEPRPTFQGASSDGSVVFFKDLQQLTDDASASGFDLYRCEIPAEDPSLGCATLTDISAPVEGSGESSQVLGLAPGVSDDGATIYFVARGILDSSPNGAGDTAAPGSPNLYRWRDGDGVRFIATLSEEDEPAWGAEFGRTLALSAGLSPSGRYLTFMSEEELTDQGNRDSETGNPVQEVFLYDSAADRLQCVSCDPSGAAPLGEELPGFAPLVDPRGQWSGQWVSAIGPQPLIVETAGISLYQPRAVLDNGRVFFNTVAPLVSADSNSQWDVYQFEPLGQGRCNASSGGSAVIRSGEGCVGLISSGTGAKEAGFLDASASGDDVFFLSPARLSLLDQDLELDVYDARVNGVVAKLSPGSECLGQDCRPSPAPPIQGSPGSATFAGPGNLKQAKGCPKGKKKVRRGGKTRCVPRKQRGHKKQGNGNRGRSR